MSLPYRPDLKLTEVLKSHAFTLSAEIIPPRNGTDQQKVLSQIEQLIKSGTQFLSVTKGAGGSLRGGSLPIAQLIKENFGVPCIAHFTCRDLTPMEVENSLVDHHYFGIRNILALRGDPPDGQPQWTPRPGGYNYAYELIGQIKRMNRGEFLPRPNGPTAQDCSPTDFCIGAAVYPEHPDEKERLEFFRLKIEAGAQYAMTDMLFEPEAYARFKELCEKAHISVPILPGTRLLKSKAQATRMASKFRVNIPPATFKRLPETFEATDSLQPALELFLEMVERLKTYGAPGVHLYVIADTIGACEAIKRLDGNQSSLV